MNTGCQDVDCIRWSSGMKSACFLSDRCGEQSVNTGVKKHKPRWIRLSEGWALPQQVYNALKVVVGVELDFDSTQLPAAGDSNLGTEVTNELIDNRAHMAIRFHNNLALAFLF